MSDERLRPLTILSVATRQGPQLAEYTPYTLDCFDLVGSCHHTLHGLLYMLTLRLQKDPGAQDCLCDYDLCGHIYRVFVNSSGDLLEGPNLLPMP